MEPVKPVKSFSTGDNICACIKLNYQKEEATLNAKWYFREDELIYEDQYNITENY